jgi:hypothetical protein
MHIKGHVDFLSTKGAAKILGISEIDLHRMRRKGSGPDCVTIDDKTAIYSVDSIVDWRAGKKKIPSDVSKNSSDLINTAQAAKILGRNECYLRIMRMQGKGPKHTKPSQNRAKYSRADVVKWGKENPKSKSGRPVSVG